MKHLAFLIAAAVLCVCEPLAAEAPQTPAFSGISVHGRSTVVATGPMVTLGEVADIISPRVEDDSQIIRLKGIPIVASPKAGESAQIEGTQILAKIQDAGVDLSSIRYTIPRDVSVTRSFREVSLNELESALSSFLGKNPQQVDVKKLVIDRPIRIPADSGGVEVVALSTTNPGHLGIDYRSLASSDEARFQLKAFADRWRMMPVATKPLKRGALVEAMDVQLAKTVDSNSSREGVENLGDILGHVLSRDVGQGELFKASTLSIPPVITAGSPVMIVVRSGRLEVTATGTAIDSGAIGQEIKVRNEGSKKVVSGKVEGPGIVVVGAY